MNKIKKKLDLKIRINSDPVYIQKSFTGLVIVDEKVFGYKIEQYIDFKGKSTNKLIWDKYYPDNYYLISAEIIKTFEDEE